MSFKISALFIDSRREFPHRFAELLWPDIQFTSFDRVGRVNEAFQKHMMTEFNICFISDKLTEPLDGFFTDIKTLGRDRSCVFVRIRSGATPDSEEHAPSQEIESGFQLAVHEQPSAAQHKELKEKLGVVWRKMEIGRRTNDIDGSVDLLMRLIDDAAVQRKRGRSVPLQHGVTSLMRMHAEFDSQIFDEFLNRLSVSLEKAAPETKRLKSIPLPILKKSLPNLSEEGYLGASNRVFRMLVDRFGEDLVEETPTIPVSEGSSSEESARSVVDDLDLSLLDEPSPDVKS